MSSSATLDVRLPIGAMFALDGAVLAVYGLVRQPEPAVTRLVGNITLGWGGLLLAFGSAMLVFALRARRRGAPPASVQTPPGPAQAP